MAASPVEPRVETEMSGNLWVKYRLEVVATLIALIVLLILVALTYHYFLRMPQIDVESASKQDVVSLIFGDAYWFHVLWIRWTAVDWVLTFLATGTALSAVIKNSVSVKSGAAAALSGWDILLVVLALFAVLGTTFDGKIHAGQLADKYRAGDLILQEARIDYAGSKKDAAATDALIKRWHEAQAMLESTSITGAIPRPSGSQTLTPQISPASGPSGAQAPSTPGSQISAPANAHPANSGAPTTGPGH